MLWLAPVQKGPSSRAHAIIVAEVLEGQTGTGGAAVTMWISDGCSAVSLWTLVRGAEICVTSPTCTTMKPADWYGDLSQF